MLEQEPHVIKGQNLLFPPETNPLTTLSETTPQALPNKIQLLSIDFRIAAEKLMTRDTVEITNFVLDHPWMAIVVPENLRKRYGADAVLFIGPETSQFDGENQPHQILEDNKLTISFGKVSHTVEFLHCPVRMTVGYYDYKETTDIQHLLVDGHETERRLYIKTSLSTDISDILPGTYPIKHGILVIPTEGLKEKLRTIYGEAYRSPNNLKPALYVTAVDEIDFSFWQKILHPSRVFP